MRTWTETRREGTDRGPVDWTHPMVAAAVERSGVSADTLRAMERDPSGFQVTNDGGWPRCGWRPVISVSMYDGWPYWTPRPAALVSGVLGPEWYWLDSLTGVENVSAAKATP